MGRAWQFDGGDVAGAIRAAAEAGLSDAAQQILDDAGDRTPVDTGDLKRSRYKRVDGLRAEIGYRDPIAHIVHENMRARHRQGRAKFLETAMNEGRDTAIETVAAKLRPFFG